MKKLKSAKTKKSTKEELILRDIYIDRDETLVDAFCLKDFETWAAKNHYPNYEVSKVLDYDGNIVEAVLVLHPDAKEFISQLRQIKSVGNIFILTAGRKDSPLSKVCGLDTLVDGIFDLQGKSNRDPSKRITLIDNLGYYDSWNTRQKFNWLDLNTASGDQFIKAPEFYTSIDPTDILSLVKEISL